MNVTGTDQELLTVHLELSHPDSWSSPVAEETGALLLGHEPTVTGDTAVERCSVYGDSPRHVDGAIEEARESPFVQTLRTLESSVRHTAGTLADEYQYARDMFVEYTTGVSMGSALADRGFIQDGPSYVGGDTETWQLLIHADRSALGRTLDSIRDDHEADITLRRVSPATHTRPDRPQSVRQRQDVLTPRQRDALDLARRRGYYEWPRETTTRELAAELGVGKSTFLHHLRTAEKALLAPDSGSESDSTTRTIPR